MKTVYYHGSEFVLTESGDCYRMIGLNSAGEDIWFPDNYMCKRILPWISLNQCSNPEVPQLHCFPQVRRLHIPEWMVCLDAQNYLFPNLEEIDIAPSKSHQQMTSVGPLLIHGNELVRVFSVGYRDSFTFPNIIRSVGNSAFAHTTIIDINFESPSIEFAANAFGGSRINQIIQRGAKQFITFGNLLYRCVYFDSPKLTIPEHICSFEMNAFHDTYIKNADGSKDWTNRDIVEEIESPVPIHSKHSFKSVKKYSVHSFKQEDIENLRWLFPNISYFCIFNDKNEEYSSDYVTHNGVLFSKDMRSLLMCPLDTSEYFVPEGVIRIKSDAFVRNQQIKHVYLPESLKYIETNAFEHCSLEKITIPQNVEIIGSYAFFDTKLKEIHFSKNVKSIGIYALCGISSIHCYEGTAKGLFDGIKAPNSETCAVTIYITRTNEEILKLFIPRGTKNSVLDLLESAWNSPTFDVQVYQKCYADIGNSIDRYRFAFRDYQISRERSVCAIYFKRIASKFAQILMDEKAEEELIELLQLGIIKAPALRKLLERINVCDMPMVSAYILQAIGEYEEKKKTLRL